jgi:type VI secretion system secreted protein Hcp
VDTAQQCFENEKPIAWSEQGPQGQPGPQGPKGDQGNKGDQGDNATTPPATQVAHAFLKLTGVTGSSTDPQHKGQIDVRSFSWGLQTTGGNSGSGGGAGKSSFQDLHFTKNHDHASAALFKAAGSGQHYQSATFSVVQNGQETIRYKLIDVTVRSFATSDGFFAVNENVSLAPKQVQLTFHDNGADVTQSFAVGKKPLVGSFSFKSQSR